MELTKKYILKEDDIGYLASAVAFQDGRMSFAKDTETSFYIATVKGVDIEIPDNLQALEMQPVAKNTSNGLPLSTTDMSENAMAGDASNATDLVLKLHVNQNINASMLPALYEEIAKAVSLAIKKVTDEKNT